MAQLVAAPQTNTAGGASGANDSANRVGLGGATGGNAPGSTGQLQLLRVAGGSAAPRTLRDEYDVFRRQFSVRSPPEQFRAALAKYMRGKEEKFLCTLLFSLFFLILVARAIFLWSLLLCAHLN